jgi:hypothetical protein
LSKAVAEIGGQNPFVSLIDSPRFADILATLMLDLRSTTTTTTSTTTGTPVQAVAAR